MSDFGRHLLKGFATEEGVDNLKANVAKGD